MQEKRLFRCHGRYNEYQGVGCGFVLVLKLVHEFKSFATCES